MANSSGAGQASNVRSSSGGSSPGSQCDRILNGRAEIGCESSWAGNTSMSSRLNGSRASSVRPRTLAVVVGTEDYFPPHWHR